VATLYDVARLAGVSTATVSRVLHGQDRVRETTRARVKKAIEELGYVPDSAAQSLSRRRKEIIGIVCIERPANHHENMNLTYNTELLNGVEAHIRDLDWSLLLTFWNGITDPDFPRLDAMSGKVDGIIIGEGSFPSRLLERLARRVPVTVIAGTPTERDVDVVTADNRAGSIAIVTHLIEVHGSSRLFHLDGPLNAPDAMERRLGLEQVLRDHPHSRLIGTTHGSFSVESGVEAGQRILTATAGNLPDAVVCANDQMAIGLMRALGKANLSVPGDVAVVGFDDIFPGSLSDPPLTTVYQPMRQLGERACARLMERIAAPELATTVELLPTELVIRSSCGCPPGTLIRQPVRPAQEQ
jgi:LacI family transcriptional regulator